MKRIPLGPAEFRLIFTLWGFFSNILGRMRLIAASGPLDPPAGAI
jgi:hypothetical protein